MAGPGPQHRVLPDGRLHLQHGPIDMILRAEGGAPAVQAAHAAAVARFATLLDELVAELPQLRQAVVPGDCPLKGAVARRMAAAARAHWPVFVTPMAAVAGAGAEAVLQAMAAVPGVTRAHVNNGGDMALYLAGGAAPFRVAIVIDPVNPAVPGVLGIGPDCPWRGVATSGARGRSHSLGIADSVTVIAPDAPGADVAATLIANAIDLPGDPSIRREPARDLAPDSDLGARPVTTHVPRLDPARLAAALDRGQVVADAMTARGLIGGAAMALQGVVRLTGDMPLAPLPDVADNTLTMKKRGLLHA
ncbi:MAG: UPF0280 family protein [Pararhodobacter sp.]|nr:UPF0280 family protein [Pararhodobacter sp.]